MGRSIDLRKVISADELLKVLQAGNNISINKGTKYHLKNGDNITVQDCFQYYLYCNFILDSGNGIIKNIC